MENNNNCVCLTCNFTAKTQTALKIHYKRKHGSSTTPLPSDQPMTNMPPPDHPGTTLPCTDHPSTIPPPTESSSTQPPANQPSTTPTLIDHPSASAIMTEETNTMALPTDHHIDHPGTTPPMTHHPSATQLIREHPNTTFSSADHTRTMASSTDHPNTNVPAVSHLSTALHSTDHQGPTPTTTDHPEVQQIERLYCRCCGFYTCTVEEMNTHLSEESHTKSAMEKNIEPMFEQCVEKVLVILLNEQKRKEEQNDQGGNEGIGGNEDGIEDIDDGGNRESAEHTLAELNVELSVPNKRKRGRPKSSQVTRCSHCGLVASNLTNLSVHIRRKHSRLYSFHCKLCNYSCVTKGDMDRHCETKKHLKRVQSNSDSQDVIVLLNPEQGARGTDGENTQNTESTTEQETPAVEEEGETEGTESNIPCKKSRNDAGNSCVHCDFVAQSVFSLELHVRRKHTQDFEFVCLACNYYAVTHREMSRHTVTERHKHKRQSYSQKQQNAQQHSENSKQLIDQSQRSGHDCTDAVDEDTGNSISPRTENTNLTEDSLDVSNQTQSAVGSSERDGKNHEDDDNDDDDDDENEDVQSNRQQGANEEEISQSFHQVEKMDRLTKGQEQEVSVRIRCGDCGFMAEGLSGLNVHITMKHPSKEKSFHCLMCGKSFPSDSHLQQHLSSSVHLRTERDSVDEKSDGGAAFRCVRCNEPCASEQELFVHIKEKHEELLQEVNKYILEDTEQINRERQENPGNVCKHCGKVCRSSNSMAFLAHIRTHTGSKPFMCKICNFATAQLGDARNHVKRHLGMREFKCHLCGWAFVMKKHLNTHLLGKHGLGQPKDRKYECEVCERSFSEKWALNNHMKLHTGQKPFKCCWPSCHYSFLTHSAMKDHYRTHTGEKSFLCDLCGFAGGTRHALTKHRRQHTGERPFQCNLCSFASTTQSHLTRHKRVHTGEKPYRCPWCDYRSNCAENIRKHILHTGKHEGVMMYNCPRCEFCTNTPSEFRNHLKDKHQDIENPDLAYLHAGIVSKSYECRLKGQGSSYVEADTPFTPDESRLGAETLQQVIIIQGYDEEAGLHGAELEEAELEESAAATLHTLAMSSSVNGELLQVTQDGCVVPYTHKNYVLVESAVGQTQHEAGKAPQVMDQEGAGHATALDALLCAVTELDQQGDTAQQDVSSVVEQPGHAQEEEQEAVQVYGEVVQVLSHTHQEVLQFAANQLMMKEGLTQVIVNDEGTHYIVTELTDSALQVDGTIYHQGLGEESRQREEPVRETENEAPVTYTQITMDQDAQV
ncbi:zinc finger protein 407 isoform X2 [Trichomycterus rosablanca]|uniref:zinc finger protein 407 isoform X2 n=1 Tax=Trichomycterus rosablanca TaxID=2290929 RepID=UPI002F352217